MKVENFIPHEGYLVVSKESGDVKTASGFQTTENTDDFLIFGEVISTNSKTYAKGEIVVFATFLAQEFRDGASTFLLVNEEDVRGTYKL